MKACWGATGLDLTFWEEDRPLLENGGDIEVSLWDYTNQKAKVHIRDNVNCRQKFKPNLGIRTYAIPHNQEPKDRKYYQVWMSKKVARQLLDEGYFGTRCEYDRLDMKYFDPKRGHLGFG